MATITTDLISLDMIRSFVMGLVTARMILSNHHATV